MSSLPHPLGQPWGQRGAIAPALPAIRHRCDFASITQAETHRPARD
ncbi:MAG: hypothetical protein KME20_11640 [Kaiparowitsia implicata GSE-PSE-MK54-09C]|nr:hypothetical protein [Kaiparowitsia implicata GSE-PSE-MK54-09C]